MPRRLLKVGTKRLILTCFETFIEANGIYLKIFVRGDQEGLFKLVTLDRILNRITGVTFGC
jgi:hypothetical protein